MQHKNEVTSRIFDHSKASRRSSGQHTRARCRDNACRNCDEENESAQQKPRLVPQLIGEIALMLDAYYFEVRRSETVPRTALAITACSVLAGAERVNVRQILRSRSPTRPAGLLGSSAMRALIAHVPSGRASAFPRRIALCGIPGARVSAGVRYNRYRMPTNSVFRDARFGDAEPRLLQCALRQASEKGAQDGDGDGGERDTVQAVFACLTYLRVYLGRSDESSPALLISHPGELVRDRATWRIEGEML